MVIICVALLSPHRTTVTGGQGCNCSESSILVIMSSWNSVCGRLTNLQLEKGKAALLQELRAYREREGPSSSAAVPGEEQSQLTRHVTQR